MMYAYRFFCAKKAINIAKRTGIEVLVFSKHGVKKRKTKQLLGLAVYPSPFKIYLFTAVVKKHTVTMD